MATIFGVPWDSSGKTTVLAGLNLGDVFYDAHGRKWRLYAVSNSLTGSALAANQVCYVAATSVTYPTGQTGSFTITNTKANALGGNNPEAVFAGIADGTVAQAASSAAADNIFCLLIINGRHNVSMVDSTAVAGDYLIHSGNGTADKVLQNDTATQTAAVLANKIGRCTIAAAASVAEGMIHDRVGGI